MMRKIDDTTRFQNNAAQSTATTPTEEVSTTQKATMAGGGAAAQSTNETNTAEEAPPIEVAVENNRNIETESLSCCAKLQTNITNLLNKNNNEQIAYTIAIYAIGDAIWSLFSYEKWGVNLQSTNDTTFGILGQWAGQQFYTTLGMSLISSLIAIRYGLKKEYLKAVDVITIFGARTLSIYTWDRAQDLGIEVFKKMGYSNNASGYFASIFAGVSEGLTQFIFIKLVKLFSEIKEYTHFKQDPHNYFLNLLIGLGLNATIGAIPGAVWQLVFNAATIGAIGGVATMLSVATCVALSALVSAKAYHAIISSECYTLNCGSTIQFTDTETSPVSQCCSCLSQFFFKPAAENSNPNAEPLLSMIIAAPTPLEMQ